MRYSPVCYGLLLWLNSKESTPPVQDMHMISGSGESPEEGNGNQLWYSCLEGHPMDERAWLQSMGSKTEKQQFV